MKRDPLYVFVAYGSYGDIYPLLEIARRMQQKKCRVLFIANEYFATTIRNAGVDYAPAGTREEQLAARETKDSNGNTFAGAMSRYDYLIGRNYQRVMVIMKELFELGETMVAVTHGRMSPVFPVSEKYGIPVILAYYAPSQIPDNREDYVLYRSSFGGNEWLSRHLLYPLHRLKIRLHESPITRYNFWRRQSGLQRVRNPVTAWLINMAKGRGITLQPRHPNVIAEIALFPEWFAEPIGTDVRHMLFTGFVFHCDDHAENNCSVDAFIEQHGSPVVFTPGTAVEDAQEFCAVIAGVCNKLSAPAIILSRYLKNSDQQQQLIDAGVPVLVLDHVDLGYVLPRSRLLVHHGGIGTLAQGIRAGVPQIIRPRMYDQPNNALRVALNGVGAMLYDDGYTADEVVTVYQHLKSSEVHCEHLAYYCDQVRKQDGAENAAHAIMNAVNQVMPHIDTSHAVNRTLITETS